MSQRRLAVLVISCLAGAAAGGTVAAQGTAPGAADAAPGLAVSVISVPAGTVRVSLPDDLAAGDTISGTVVAEPRGRTETERAGNGAVLQGYVVDAGSEKTTVGRHVLTFIVPAGAATAILILRDPRGKQVGRADVPVGPRQPAPPRPPQPADFRFPQIGVAGQPLIIQGPFSGEVAKTRLTIGGQAADVLAESPRRFIAAPAPGIAGPSEYRLVENGVAVTAPCTVISVKLTAPKTRLTRGERVAIHIVVDGLTGIREPVNLKLVNRTPAVITLAGGAMQVLTIRPGDVSAGAYATDREVTGVGNGAYAITATLDDRNPPAYVSGAPPPR